MTADFADFVDGKRSLIPVHENPQGAAIKCGVMAGPEAEAEPIRYPRNPRNPRFKFSAQLAEGETIWPADGLRFYGSAAG